MSSQLRICLYAIMTVCLFLMNVALAPDEAIAQKKPKYIIKFCSEGTLDVTWTSVGVKFGEILEKLTDGEVKTETYPNGALAAGGKAVDMLRLGSIQMYVDGPGVFSNIFPYLSIFEMPYVYDDIDHANRVLDSKLSQDIFENFRKASGIRVLGTLCYGFRETTTKRPLRSLEDFKGLKIRVGPVPVSIALWKALGANPTPIEWSELYTSLATGVVDAQENPMFVIEMARFYEVAKYLNLTSHQALNPVWVVNEAFFQTLPKDYQAKAVEAMRKAVLLGREEVRGDDKKVINSLKEKGMEIVRPDKDALKKASGGVYKQFLNVFDERTYLDLRSIR